MTSGQESLTPRLHPADKQFRTATPVHMYTKRNGSAYPDADDSASSSSSSSSASSEDSAFPSSPYTYQSTHRTTTSSRYAAPLNSTGSAIPAYLQSKPAARSSMDYSSTLTVPRAPSPRRTSAEYDRPRKHHSSSASKAPRSTHREPAFTTSSYQPPAPAFGTRPMNDFSGSLRLPTRAPVSNDSNSLNDSIATLSVKDTGGSGYNEFTSTRPPKLDGTALDAGVHGMKRSWDGFKCESLLLWWCPGVLGARLGRWASFVEGTRPLTRMPHPLAVEVKFGA